MTDHGKTDVLVLGAGVIGLAAAHYLLKAERSVRVLDVGALGKGSSYANCGLITPSHVDPIAKPGMLRQAIRWSLDRRSPFYVKPTLRPSRLRWFLDFMKRCNSEDVERSSKGRAALLQSSRALYDALIAEEGIACEWKALGLLIVYKSEEEMEAHVQAEPFFERYGVPCRLHAGAALRALEPALRDDVAGAHLFPQDAHLRPDRLVEELARLVRGAGGLIEEGCGALRIEAQNGRVDRVRSDRGAFGASEVVLATGAWTSPVAARIGLRIPIQPGKGYTVTMQRPKTCPARPLLLNARRIAVTPWASGYRLGGTMEFSGYSTRIAKERVEAILDGTAEYLKDPVGEGERKTWSGWRPMTPDSLPFIGRSPKHENLTIAAGHGMLGVSMAPATGKLVAEILTGKPAHVDPAPYRLDRP